MAGLGWQTERWCQGLKSTGYRELVADEINRLEEDAKFARSQFGQAVLVGAPCPLVLYLSYVIVEDGPETPGPRLIIGLAFLFVGLMVLPALSLLKLRDAIHLRRALRCDLKDRNVECFSPVKSPREGDVEASLEVLPHSSLVFRVNGKFPSRRIFAEIYETTPPPKAAAQYGLPAEMVSSVPDQLREQTSLDRRRLSPDEIDELAQHIRRLRRPSGTLVLFVIWFGMGLTAAIASYLHGDFSSWQGQYLLPFVLLAAVTTWLCMSYVRVLLTSRKLAQDAASAWVLVVEPKDGEQSRQEVLPISSTRWSTGNEPSPWRLLPGKKQPQRHQTKNNRGGH